jgi:hypothetical protein
MARPQVRGTSSACSVKTVAILLGAGRGGYGYLPGLTSTSTTILRPSECDARLVSAATPRPKRSRRILTPPQRRVDVLHDRQKYPAGSGECQRLSRDRQQVARQRLTVLLPSRRPGQAHRPRAALQRNEAPGLYLTTLSGPSRGWDGRRLLADILGQPQQWPVACAADPADRPDEVDRRVCTRAARGHCVAVRTLARLTKATIRAYLCAAIVYR